MAASSFYYFASPYHGTEEQMEFRLQENIRATASLLQHNIHVFCPIMNSQALLRELKLDKVESRRDIIVPYDLTFLHAAKGMILYTLPGWDKSWGVDVEIKECQMNRIPVYTLSPEQLDKADFGKLFDSSIDVSKLKAA